ncbi:hypothetical protein D3C71_1425020 [compost metagenome]
MRCRQYDAAFGQIVLRHKLRKNHAKLRAGLSQSGELLPAYSQKLQQLGIIIPVRHIEELHGGGIGGLIDFNAGQPVIQVIGNHQNAMCTGQFFPIMHKELIQRIERQLLDTCLGIYFFRRYQFSDFLHSMIRTSITVSVDVLDPLTVFIQQHIVDSPGVDTECA